MSDDMHEIEVIHLPGLTHYEEMLRTQHARRDAVESGAAPDTLYLLEHAPVVTLGRKAHEENLLRSREELASLGVAVCNSDRGGDVTYHGPGQLVAYPILNLNRRRPSIQWYLRGLEEILIRQVARYGLRGERVEGLTGVWVGGGKVAAIGIGIHRWTTFHGIALNVCPDLAHFGYIVPCGIVDKPVASLDKLLRVPPSFRQAAADFEEEFLHLFGIAE